MLCWHGPEHSDTVAHQSRVSPAETSKLDYLYARRFCVVPNIFLLNHKIRDSRRVGEQNMAVVVLVSRAPEKLPALEPVEEIDLVHCLLFENFLGS